MVSANELDKLPEEGNWKNLIQGKWTHQADAVGFVLHYLANALRQSRNAAIVRMPTGTGKTGIMAIVANYAPKVTGVLIVAPSEFLTGQIQRKLADEFWQVAKMKPPGNPKPVFKFVPTNLSKCLSDASGASAVYVCTQQTLSQLYADSVGVDPTSQPRWGSEFKKLQEIVSVLFVDEGHREPAKQWARAVRSFKKPTVLFTATPYRNDIRFFRVGRGSEYRHKLSYQDSLSAKIIRDVRFFTPSASYADDPKAFARQLSTYFRNTLTKTVSKTTPNPKVIIRCEDVGSIKAVQNAVSHELPKHRTIAIHDSFDAGEEQQNRFREVPRPGDPGYDATFWIHQYKLTEGIDEADFRMVAFFHPFDNSRSLVQQIGRIIRNPSGKKGEVAIVFCDKSDDLEEQWNGYLEFEKSAHAFIGPDELIDRLLESLPEWFYYDSRYRKKADLSNRDIIKDLRIPKSISIFRVGKRSIDLDELQEDISDALQERDTVELARMNVPSPAGDLYVLLSWRVSQSERISNAGLFDLFFLPSLFVRKGEYIFYQGIIALDEVNSALGLEQLSPNDLERLLNATKPVVSQVSLVNCDIGSSSVRRRAIGARALDDVAPGLSDHLNFVSTAVTRLEQSHGRSVRRYLGFTRGRISDVSERLVDTREFGEWVGELSRSLSATTNPDIPVLRRYADYVPAPKTSKAAHILLDLKDFFETYESSQYDVDKLRLSDETMDATVGDVQSDGSFNCRIGKDTIAGKVKYVPTSGRFIVQSEDLNNAFERRSNTKGVRQSASSFLSNRVVLRIVTTDLLFYSEKRFYKPRVPLLGNNRIHNLGILVGVDSLAIIEAEKGEKNKIGRGTWQAESIFGLIDQENSPLFQRSVVRPDILVCDDLGTEICDFVAVDQSGNGKITLIHAKMWGGTSSFSASDFHVINSQVIKNLEYLNAFGTVAKSKATKWAGRWMWSTRSPKNKRLKRIRRHPLGLASAKAIAAEIQRLLNSSMTEKEVWVVLGKGFSLKGLNDELGKDPPVYNVAQLAYLLQACNNSVSSVGARLRIFCSP